MKRILIDTSIILFAFLLLLSAGNLARDEQLKTETQMDADTIMLASEILKAEQENQLDSDRVYLGEFTLTAYCSCAECCGKWSDEQNPVTASGAPAVAGVTVGADWNTIPKGSLIEIEGVGLRCVQDKPADWIVSRYDGRILDIYFDSHQEAVHFGRRKGSVYLEKENHQ